MTSKASKTQVNMAILDFVVGLTHSVFLGNHRLKRLRRASKNKASKSGAELLFVQAYKILGILCCFYFCMCVFFKNASESKTLQLICRR